MSVSPANGPFYTLTGQLPVGVTYSPWFDCSGVSEVRLDGAFSGGVTAVYLEGCNENYYALTDANNFGPDLSSQLGAGKTVPLGMVRYVRFRFEQSGGPTATAQFTAKADQNVVPASFSVKPSAVPYSVYNSVFG